MKVHGEEEKVIMTRKQKAESINKQADDHTPKKAKIEIDDAQNTTNGKSSCAEFDDLSKAMSDHLSVDDMRQILEANGVDSSASSNSDLQITRKCEDLLLYGALEKCPVCNGNLEFDGRRYCCRGFYSEWCSCTFSTRDPPRKHQTTKLPDSLHDTPVAHLLKKYEDATPAGKPHRDLGSVEKPFTGMTISLMGRLSRTHHYWKTNIEKHGGKVANSIIGVTCLVASPAERERGGTSKLAEVMERGIPVVTEAWLGDTIEKQEPQPLDAYGLVTHLSAAAGDKHHPGDHPIESLASQLKLYGKRGVYKDTKLQEQGGYIFDKDGILYNCAFSLCDQARQLNHYSVMQLIMVPENHLHLFFKKARAGDDLNAEERLEEFDNVDIALGEFTRLFEEITGNEFEPWERDKKFRKKPLKFYPIDMDDGVEVRHGALGLRQLGIAATHCKLEPLVANFVKVLCSQEIYRYALMEMGYDSPDLPIGMVTQLHLKRCEEALLEFIEKVKSSKEEESGPKAEAVWTDFSQRWFTMMPSPRPFLFRDYQEIAEHAAAALEGVRDITVASHLIGDLSGSTIDDPLSETYNKLGCSISPLEKDSDDYDMIVKYLEKTYEPVKVGDMEYGVSVENIFSVETSACPPYEDIVKLPNKVLLWCGSRSSNLLRHLHKGFLPAMCSLPVPGYMFGRAIVCSDAAAEAARYGFTAVDRPEGFLVLAIASLGNEITELKTPPEDTASLEEKKVGVKGLGKKKTDESEHFVWKDDIKVPSGRIVASEHKDSPLEYNEYAVYDPMHVRICYLVGVKYEEKGAVMDTAE